MNRTTIIGNLTKAPDIRQTQSGVSVCTFAVAVNRRYADQGGEKQTDFFNVVCWRALADNCGKYLTKGSKVGVHGSLQNRSYEAKDGTRRYVTEIIADEVEFLSRGVEAESTGNAPAYEDIQDNELPF